MAEKNIFNVVVDEMKQRRELMRGELKTRFAHTEPFRKEKVADDDLLYHYNVMNNDPNRQLYIDTMIANKGEDEVNKFIMKMELLKRKRGL